ncbi:4-(cytidine 5'-diphospho)-2-C-methyl-D-erythritol kinase [Shimia sediminis]|uniref:4-(cytidine 5'-diphospho)-2-C-methyl-D-erythritol kinase n=1 Tax=Shimia sediminis TaxID=2497945 RepID=UPI000F8ED0EA|nr:4-(cytidine 5'-diphospho)-2-C-methyl-D-erythritol kinase [Shimia sediminis]
MKVKAFAPAKINLTLHVTGQRADGYHLLDSLVVFGDAGDDLGLSAGPEMRLQVSGPFAEGVPEDQTNLVWRAAQAAGWTGTIHLQKNLPHGAGIGGGSSDAAAVLRALSGDSAARGIGLQKTLSLGADVPVCLYTGPQRMQGIGEQVTRIWSVPRLHLMLVNPGCHVPTPQVFRALRQRDNAAMADCGPWPDASAFVDWLSRQRNDLEAPAVATQPVIGDVLQAIQASEGCELARMSGSGATCFGVFPDGTARDQAVHRLGQRHPEWWVVPVTTAGAETR